MRHLLGLCLLIGLIFGAGQWQPVVAQDGGNHPPATLINTEVFPLTSTHVNDDYKISVALPFGYTQSDQTYPVIYLLDPHFLFGTVTEQTRLMGFNEDLPQVIIVGIGYPDDLEVPIQAMRGRDYIPGLNFSRPTSLGTAKFLAFIKEELIPTIESRYRANPAERAILGYSFSGEFTLYAFSQEPDLFAHIIAVSPALPWTNAELAAYADDITPDTLNRTATVFLSVGNLEGSSNTMENYAVLLERRGYSDLTVKTLLIEDATHYTAFGIGLIRGLQTSFCLEESTYRCELR